MRSERPTSDYGPRLIAWAKTHSDIRAVLLTSTRAIPDGPVDALSDYDVILVVQDIHPFLKDRSWLNAFGEVLVAYWDPIRHEPDSGVEFFTNVIQYDDGLKIDFTIWPIGLLQHLSALPTLPAELDAGYRVLLDKDGLTAGMRAPTYKAYIPTKPTREAYQTRVNDFLSNAPYVAKYLWRGELLPAKWCLDNAMKQGGLRQMLEWRVESDHEWSMPTRNLGKGLESHLPKDIRAQLERTYVGADAPENWEALARTMALFRQVAIEVGDRLGYSYPEVLHKRVRDYVEDIRRIPASNGGLSGESNAVS